MSPPVTNADPTADDSRNGITPITPSGNSLPVSAEAERAILSCIALEPERCFPLVSRHINQLKRLLGIAKGEGITPPPANQPKPSAKKLKTVSDCTKESAGFFYKTQHAILYSALNNTYTRHHSCDLILVTQHLNDHDLLAQAGGPAAPVELLDDVSSTTVLHHYLAICTEKFMQRRALEFATELRATALTPPTTAGDTNDQFLRGIIAARQSLSAIETIAINRGNLQQLALNTDDTDPENTLNPLPELLTDLNAVPPHDPIYITGYIIPESLAHLAENTTTENEDGETETQSGRILFSLSEINTHTTDPRLAEILRNRWIVTLINRDEANTEWIDLTPLHTFLKDQLDNARRLSILHLITADQTSATAETLRTAAEQDNAKLPDDILWESGLVFYGANGGLNLREDILARRIVLQKQILYCGGEFWIWTAHGVWKKLTNSHLYLQEWMRQALRKTEDGLELITKNRIASVASLIQSTHFLEPEQLNR